HRWPATAGAYEPETGPIPQGLPVTVLDSLREWPRERRRHCIPGSRHSSCVHPQEFHILRGGVPPECIQGAFLAIASDREFLRIVSRPVTGAESSLTIPTPGAP